MRLITVTMDTGPIVYKKVLFPEYYPDGSYSAHYKKALKEQIWWLFHMKEIDGTEAISLFQMIGSEDEYVTVAAAILDSKSVQI